jgi:hypothetical protein
VRSAFASDVFLSSFCDSAESDFCGVADPRPKEPKPPDGWLGCAGAASGDDDDDDEDRRLNDPKLVPLDFADEYDGFDGEDERCDEKPLLKELDEDGLASTGPTCASGSSRASTNATL